MAIDTGSGFPEKEHQDDEVTTGTTSGTAFGTTDADTTTGDGHPPRVKE